jgi:transcription antitermination factor NusA-like protein
MHQRRRFWQQAGPEPLIHKLFNEHVPEVATGELQVVAAARDKQSLLAALRSTTSEDPAFVDLGSSGLCRIGMELQLTTIWLILWTEDVASLIVNAIGQIGGALAESQVRLDDSMFKAWVELDRSAFFELSEKQQARTRLASQLVGMEIQLVPSGS